LLTVLLAIWHVEEFRRQTPADPANDLVGVDLEAFSEWH